MTYGKAITAGAIVRRPDLTGMDIGWAELDEFKNKSAENIDRSKELEASVVGALEVYLGSHIGTPVPTATLRNIVLSKLATAAQNLAKNQKSELWRTKLHVAYQDLDINGRAMLQRSLTAKARKDGVTTIGTAALSRLPDALDPFSDDDFWVLGSVVEIAKRGAKKMKYADPYLPELVISLQRAWTMITGRSTLIEKMLDNVDDLDSEQTKLYPFIEWVNSLIKSGIELALESREPDSSGAEQPFKVDFLPRSALTAALAAELREPLRTSSILALLRAVRKTKNN